MISAYPATRIRLLVALLTVSSPCLVFAETPGEIPKPWTYEGSMKLQEQQRQQDQQFQQQGQPTPGGGRSASGAGSAAAAEEVRRNWQKRPPLPPERNPLLGKWNPQGTATGGKSGDQLKDAASALVGSMLGGACDSMFGRGTIEFRPKTLVSIENSGERVLNHVEYRGDGSRVAVLPQDPGSIGVLVFDFQGKDRIRAEGLGCAMARPGTAPPAASSAAASNVARDATPAATASAAVLSLSVISSGQGGSALAGRPLWVLKSDPQFALIKGGVQSTPYGTPLQNWMRACQSRTPVCQQGANALKPFSVGIATTDVNGHAQTPPLAIGRYWVLSDAKVDNRHLMWNQPVDVKAGSNSLTLDRQNSMPVD